LSPHQFGFRPDSSNIDAVCKLIANVLTAMDNRQHCLAVLLDLSKAFDTIDHVTLLTKLSHYGVRGVALDWFRSYISNRMQFVNYRGIESMRHAVTCGVPQGSVLGPLLFIIYTNDLPMILKNSKCILFADDTTIYCTGDDIADMRFKIERDLETLADWFNANSVFTF
jgi:retron-type reverse transcriptase